MKGSFIDIPDLSIEQLKQVLKISRELRQQRAGKIPHNPLLLGKSILMIFEKPSLRTRLSFEVAINELGGHPIVMAGGEVGLGQREKVSDVAQVVQGMAHGVVARVFEHDKLQEFDSHCDLPVINALSDDSHPCQAMADILTMQDAFGDDLSGRTLTFVGDGNNVARSLAELCPALGIRFVLSSPKQYALPDGEFSRIREIYPDAQLELIEDPEEAVREADAIYTDTWVSMGKEEEKQARLKTFAPYQINAKLLKAAPDNAIVLHCLPAYRDLEITEEVLEGPQSRVFPQAHNRLHAQKGLLAYLYEA